MCRVSGWSASFSQAAALRGGGGGDVDRGMREGKGQLEFVYVQASHIPSIKRVDISVQGDSMSRCSHLV